MRERLAAAMYAFRNPYAPKSEHEADWQQAMAEQVRREARRLAELSAEMVQDARYGELRKLYQRILEQNVRLLVHYDPPSGHPDPVVAYFEAMRRFQMQLRVLMQIVELPREFSAKAEDLKEAKAPPQPAKAYAEQGGS